MSGVRACIVSYRSGDLAVRASRSAVSSGADTVLVDNCPGDSTAETVAREVPEARVISAPRNLGFAAGSNLAAEGAETEHLLFLNPDATLDPGALDALAGYLDEHPEAGIVGPELRFPDGRSQPSIRRDPTAAAILHQYTAWKFALLFRGAYRRYRSPPAERDGPRPVPVLMGSALLVRTSLFRELGGFDERYFMYFEEADLCRRARERGAEVVYLPAARAVHEGGASASLAGSRLAAERLVSAQRYLARFSPRGRHLMFRAAFLVGFPVRAMIDLLRDLAYAAGYSLLPGKQAKVRGKALEALGAARLLTADLFRVVKA